MCPGSNFSLYFFVVVRLWGGLGWVTFIITLRSSNGFVVTSFSVCHTPGFQHAARKMFSTAHITSCFLIIFRLCFGCGLTCLLLPNCRPSLHEFDPLPLHLALNSAIEKLNNGFSHESKYSNHASTYGKLNPVRTMLNFYSFAFSGGVIAMPPPLMDGQIEYSDGTPATVSQVNWHLVFASTR